MIKEIFIEGVGNVVITKRKGVKRMTLSIRPFRPVRVTIPYYLSYSSAANFVKEKKEWIMKSREKISKTENKRRIFDLNSNFKIGERILHFEQSDQDQIRITKSKIIVYYKNAKEIQSDEMQSFIRKGISEALRIEAKNHIPGRVKFLAQKYGFSYKNVSVRNAKTRWGSCSGANNISLNIQLMRLPDHLIDYVILHELCHTVEKNHGKKFWALLDKITGNAKVFDKELKSYSPELF